MPKGQPNSRDVPLAAVALLAPFVSRAFAYEWDVGDGSRPGDTARVTAVEPREQLRGWLTETRQLAAAVLASGWEQPREPRRLRDGTLAVHPKSPYWRGVQSLTQPLRPDERGDFELIVSVADTLLAQLEHADENALGVLWQAMTLTQATARIEGDLLFRIFAPDKDDATSQRQALVALAHRGRKGLMERWGPSGRKATRQELEKAVRAELTALRARRIVPAWSKVCDSVGKRFGLTGRRVRELLKDSALRPKRR